MKRWNSDDAS